MEYNTNGKSLLDGSIGNPHYWYYAIGASEPMRNGIGAVPYGEGRDEVYPHRVELYVIVE